MCSGLNFTKINQKSRRLITSILARFGSSSEGKGGLAAVQGTGIQGDNCLNIGKQVNKTKR